MGLLVTESMVVTIIRGGFREREVLSGVIRKAGEAQRSDVPH
jgi:hypothetical protein